MKAKSRPDILQAWLKTQDLPPTDRLYMKEAAANDKEVFRVVAGHRDYLWSTPSKAQSGWSKISGLHLSKAWSYADVSESRITPQKSSLKSPPFQKNLTWRDGGIILLVIALVCSAFYLWIRFFSATMELYIWLMGFYFSLILYQGSAKWQIVRAQTKPPSPWRARLMALQQSLLLQTIVCLGMGFVCAHWLFMPMSQQLANHFGTEGDHTFKAMLTTFLPLTWSYWWFNCRLDARLNTEEHAHHYELWLYHQNGSRTCYARANEHASLELLQNWLKVQQQRYFDAHPTHITHTNLTGRL